MECVERGLDPMTTNLVVADKRRTEKTICLAVSPSLKAYGISGRARLFEVVQRVAEVNAKRKWDAPGHQLTGASWNDPEVQENPALALDYIVAPPRMAHYIDWSTKIYSVYLKYVAPEDIFPYSIDEVFMDITNYLDTYKMTARELTRTMILDVLKTTGITAAAGFLLSRFRSDTRFHTREGFFSGGYLNATAHLGNLAVEPRISRSARWSLLMTAPSMSKGT